MIPMVFPSIEELKKMGPFVLEDSNGNQFTYLINQHSQKNMYFVDLLMGDKEFKHYSYIAYLGKSNNVRWSARSRVEETSPPLQLIQKLFDEISSHKEIDIKVYYGEDDKSTLPSYFTPLNQYMILSKETERALDLARVYKNNFNIPTAVHDHIDYIVNMIERAVDELHFLRDTYKDIPKESKVLIEQTY